MIILYLIIGILVLERVFWWIYFTDEVLRKTNRNFNLIKAIGKDADHENQDVILGDKE